MSHSITSRKDLLMSSLQSFFDKTENIIKIISVINNNRKISLRVIDWFVTNYSKKCNASYIINNNTNKLILDKADYDPACCSEFVVYLNYKLQLKAYSKGQFDPFCRRSRLDFHYNKDKILNYIEENNLTMPDIVEFLEENTGGYITTTSGQLNFFRWIIKKNIIEYITTNITEIEEDMNTCYKKHYKKKSKNNKSSRKKRHELSVSASKSLSKSNVKVILTFN
tara:strand:- start:380 stop:1051 length:672 start_codon:yes stop_codon:yes gene_type:complete